MPESAGAQMADDERLFVCDAEGLLDGGRGVRFALLAWGQPATGFVIRHRGQVHGYLNRCARSSSTGGKGSSSSPAAST